jgi:energy-coupling factor transport system permease protein
MAGTVIPVLEDAIDSSLSLAASMDSRGFGRRGNMSKSLVLSARLSSLMAVGFLSIGSFTLLVGQTQTLGWVLIGVGIMASFASIRINSKSQIRTRYEPAKLQFFDAIVLSFTAALLIAAILGLIA